MLDREAIRQNVNALIDQKNAIEAEIARQGLILQTNGIGMNEPLVDEEGYPLSSVDVWKVRHARQRIICLQNDHKALMKRIENGLNQFSTSSTSIQVTPMQLDRRERIIYKTPFAKVTLVSAGSPAERAGIVVDDEVVEFGSVNATNFTNITDIATVVQHSQGARVNIKIKRSDSYLTLTLIPKKWAGKGLLGCNIVAL